MLGSILCKRSWLRRRDTIDDWGERRYAFVGWINDGSTGSTPARHSGFDRRREDRNASSGARRAVRVRHFPRTGAAARSAGAGVKAVREKRIDHGRLRFVCAEVARAVLIVHADRVDVARIAVEVHATGGWGIVHAW